MIPYGRDYEEPPESLDEPSAEWLSRMLAGGAFIHDAPDHVPAVWGHGDAVLWAEGEPLIITGPTGVGKTTLGGQLVHARLGLQDKVIGYPVKPGQRVLYLAMDRPAQIRRALARLMRKAPREVLDEQLTVWPGPPPVDLARHPTLLYELCQHAKADTVIIDSLKDAAVKLSDEEVGQGLNRGMQLCVANGIEVLAYHHQTKRGAGGVSKPNSLADVYGSAWITAGCGSVVLLWGNAGDPVVEMAHLKQPADEVGPLKLVHDHTAGTTSIFHADDVLAILLSGPQSAREVATVIHGDSPTDAQVEKARRKLDKLVRDGQAIRLTDAMSGGASGRGKGGGSGAKYAAAARPDDAGSVHGSVHAPLSGPNRSTIHESVHDRGVSADKSVHGSVHGVHAPIGPRTPPPLRGGVAWSDGSGAEFDRWVLAHLTRTPQPVGTISGNVQADPFDVQASLERLAATGHVIDHPPAGPGPHTWALPDRDLDQWPR
ncbi:MAG: AAA family ATPase [Actinomycetota bacterium]|nr:AAA family ATPase [Actinomycetota bacterium]